VRNGLIEFRRHRFGLAVMRQSGDREGETGGGHDHAELHGLSPSVDEKMIQSWAKKKYQEDEEIMYYEVMSKPLSFDLDRTAKISLAEQIRRGISTAIESGVLEPGARLPSWQDLAAQLGVARGTVRTAYEQLAAAQLIEASRATRTRVAHRPRAVVKTEPPPDVGSFMETYREMTQEPAFFKMGVPATETFPATLF